MISQVEVEGRGRRVLVAMSGGVDSSVAAALLLETGYEVVGVTMKLWGGDSDTGCCSVSDVDDARRVAAALGIDHHVFNFGDDFDQHVVAPYVADHRAGRTPNPCVECNRHIKFAKLLRRATALGFDLVATGHHARIAIDGAGRRFLRRGVDGAKDQSYVLAMLGQAELARTLLPVGDFTKAEVRAHAGRLGLRTAAKPDSQDVCFITTGAGRAEFLRPRLDFTPGQVLDTGGAAVGRVEAVELVTIGQRRGLGLPGGSEARYVVGVDVGASTVTVGTEHDLQCSEVRVDRFTWAETAVDGEVEVQCSAHGPLRRATLDHGAGLVRWATPQRRVAPGQLVAFYRGDLVVGSATVASPST